MRFGLLLAAGILLGGQLAHAQMRSGTSPPGPSSSLIVTPAPHGFGRTGARGFGRHFRHFRSPRFGPFVPAFFYPYDDYSPFDGYAPAVESPLEVVIRQEGQAAPAASLETPASPGAKLIELPSPAERRPAAPAPAKLPPTLFVLSNGQRIEAQRYTITGDSVYIVKDRRQSTRISLDDLDVAATLEANRQSGIELRIPSGPSELFLSY